MSIPTKAEQLVLPFKPFTLGEVQRLSGISAKQLDAWTLAGGKDGALLPLRVGDDGLGFGLDWMQTFACFVGAMYIKEGAPADRVNGVVHYVAAGTLDALFAEFDRGNTFPVPANMLRDPISGQRLPPTIKGVMVPAPDSRLGKALNLKALLAEFRESIAKEFPNG